MTGIAGETVTVVPRTITSEVHRYNGLRHISGARQGNAEHDMRRWLRPPAIHHAIGHKRARPRQQASAPGKRLHGQFFAQRDITRLPRPKLAVLRMRSAGRTVRLNLYASGQARPDAGGAFMPLAAGKGTYGKKPVVLRGVASTARQL